jgi:hypothetical protein
MKAKTGDVMEEENTVENALYEIQILGKKVAAIGFLIQFCQPDIGWDETTTAGIGILLEEFGNKAKSLSEAISETLTHQAEVLLTNLTHKS